MSPLRIKHLDCGRVQGQLLLSREISLIYVTFSFYAQEMQKLYWRVEDMGYGNPHAFCCFV